MGEMKNYEVAILGLMDKNGRCYAGQSYLRGDEKALSPLRVGEVVETDCITIFPYDMFSSFTPYDLNRFSLEVLWVEAPFTEEEYQGFSAGDIRSIQFFRRRVRLIRVLDNPWAYGAMIYAKKKETAPPNHSSNIRYELLTWLSKLSFKNEEEFEVYLRLLQDPQAKYSWKHYEFSPTRFNLQYLPRILQETQVKLDLHYITAMGIYQMSAAEFRAYINGLDDELFYRFHSRTFFSHEELANPERRNKAFFERAIADGYGIEEFFDFMPQEVFPEMDADVLLDMTLRILWAMLKDEEYEPEEVWNYDDVEYDRLDMESYADIEDLTYTHDARDGEMVFLEPILPLVTEKSLPILRTLVWEKISPHLSAPIREILEKENPGLA